MKILICGDYIVHDNLKVNSKEIFGDFLEVIQNSDISIYNQEHPVSNSQEIYSTKRFGTTDGCSPKLLKPILDAGFTCVSLSNNHIFNKGISGLDDTISFFKSNGITPFGAGRNIEEAKKILYVDKQGLNLAFLNFAENEFNTATPKHGGTNPLDIIDNVNQIKEAKKNADFVFVIIHGGLEYCHIPTPRMVKQYRFYADNGASAIICHHSHVVSGYEVYNNCPIFYGIGNFIPAKPVKVFLSNAAARYSFPVQFEITDKNSIAFRGFPLKYNLETNKLEYLRNKELDEFIEMQNKIFSMLGNELLLKQEIIKRFLVTNKKSYYYTLFTRSTYFWYKLFRKFNLLKAYSGLIERKMRFNKKNSITWNLFRCETHRDVLDLIYEEYIDTYTND